MAEFIAFETNIEVNGQTIHSVVEGMKSNKEMAFELLKNHGISNLDASLWYSQQDWLDTFKEIAHEIGEKTLFNIGKSILDHAQFPPNIDEVHKGLGLIDIAYHMNHRKNGIVMFDGNNGTMEEGIGHYEYTKISSNKGKLVAFTPYPCEFDRGIITSMARRFQPLAEVNIDGSVKNKKDGNDSSTYIISW